VSRQFNELKATELYCPTCKTCGPVREKTLPTSGDPVVELLCARCRTVVGRHTTTEDKSVGGRLARLAGRLFPRAK
jgi:hypothetical protein